MAKVMYIASPEGGNGRNVVAYGVIRELSSRQRTGLFRPVRTSNALTGRLLGVSSAQQDICDVFGVSERYAREEPHAARTDILANFYRTLESCDAETMIVVGTDASRVFTPERFNFDAHVAADLHAPVLLAICARERTTEELRESIASCAQVVDHAGTHIAGIFITGCDPGREQALQLALADLASPHWTLPALEFPPECTAEAAELAGITFNEHVTQETLTKAMQSPAPCTVTAYAFQDGLLGKARSHRKTIVLPEGEEPRILQAADYLLARDVVDITILADRPTAMQQAQELGLQHVGKATFQPIDDPDVLEPVAQELHRLRAGKGMTLELAHRQLTDATYFGTMLVHMGYADGLVSGSCTSTAQTVRPALQVIKTKPGASLVSSAFLMCFNNRISLFADCAINIDPSAQELAQIALQTTETARAFGIDPRVGMLSYSTLGSGKGPDVQLVEEATDILHHIAPELPAVGPIQFDAALSPTVAALKAPGDPVAGRVNVFIFPNLTAGNIAYKAIQRTSGAMAVGPVLQGLRKPVNDLSRGALVQDIINTVALTAIEAQHS